MAELPALARRFARTPALRGSRSRSPLACRSPWSMVKVFPVEDDKLSGQK